jgi:hypothetical protein
MRKPAARQLDVLRWVVAAALAVTYIFTGYEPVFYVGLAILLLPFLLRKKRYPGDEPKDPDEPR